MNKVTEAQDSAVRLTRLTTSNLALRGHPKACT